MSPEHRDERCHPRGEHLLDADLPADPIELFATWLGTALHASRHGLLREPTAMALSTVTRGTDGGWCPRSRMVHLSEYTAEGFGFLTSHESDKGAELNDNPHASLLFWWPVHARQVRAEGVVERLSRAESERYFSSWPRTTRLGAWATRQSRPVRSIRSLNDDYERFEDEFADRDVDCPPAWSGYLLRPSAVEFWQGQPRRLHDRVRYHRAGGGWLIQRLNP